MSELETGALRIVREGEAVDPAHITTIDGEPHVPARLYGATPPERNNRNGHSKGSGNGHAVEASVIPNQSAVMGETLISSSADIFVAPVVRTETPRNEARASRPWGSHVVTGAQLKGPGRVRGLHLSSR